MFFFEDSYIIVRDRTPVNSDTHSSSDSSSSSSDDEDSTLGRIIVPPNVNCVVRDNFVRKQLANILNAQVTLIPYTGTAVMGVMNNWIRLFASSRFMKSLLLAN